MKNNLKKVLSMICIFTMLLSCTSVMGVQAANEELSIITAQFVPYEQEIRVLASVPTGYTDAKVYVNDVEIATAATTQADGDVLFTSTSFVPSAYGIATVKLEAIVNGNVCSDTQNIKVYKVTSKTEALTESFQGLDAIEMENVTDTTVTELLAASSNVILDNVANEKNNSIASIANNYGGTTGDNKSLVVAIPNTLVSNIPTIKVDPDNITAGIAELNFDMYASKASPRLSLRFETTTGGAYTYTSLKYPKNTSLHSGSYYVKHHDYATYAFSDEKYENGKWHNIRFLIDFDNSTYEYYVDHKLIDYGTIVASKGTGYKYVYMQIGCSGEDVAIAFDNVIVNHLNVDSISASKEQNIVATADFENGFNNEFEVAYPSANSNSASAKAELRDGRNVTGVYYNAKVTTRRKEFVSIYNDFDEPISGRIVIEHDMYLSDGSARIQYEFKNSENSVCYYPFTVPENRFQLKETSTVGANSDSISYSGWHKIKLILDTVTQTSEMYFDDKYLGSSADWSMNYPTTSANLAPEYVDRIELAYSAGSARTVGTEYLGFAIDNWRVYKELPVSEMTSVTKYDINANSAALVRTDVISAASTDKFEIALTSTEYLNQASLEANAKVLADGVEVQDSVSLSDGILTIDVSDVPAHADLELVVGKDTLLYDGTTTIGADTVFNLKTANENDLYIKRTVGTTAESLNATCKLDLVSGSKDVAVIFASYDGDELVGITSRTYTLTGAKSLSMTLPKSNATKVKLFVCDNLESSITPYETELEYSIPSQN
ncbi:MAG: hypothetical protein E7395_00050 [Ruminococcaceae bacterium]|nr:hypothetical protein [Oscillospiraceae bacterium]